MALVLYNQNNGEHCWLVSGPEDDHWHPSQRGYVTEGHYWKRWLFTECCSKAYSIKSGLEGRNWVGKVAQATGITPSLRILSSKADSNTWERFTRSELKLESVHQESPCSDVIVKGQQSHFWNRNIVRSILPGLRRKITGLLLCGPKSPFQIIVHFAFNLEIKVWRLERYRIQAAWSPVWSFRSQWWFGLPWCLLVCWSIVFYQVQSQCSHLPGDFGALYASICWQALWRCWFPFPAGRSPAHRAKTTSKWFADHDISVLDWPANMSDLNPIWNLGGIFKRKMKNSRSNNTDELKVQ